LLYIGLHWWGIAGAAFAWCARVTVDLIGLLVFTKKINPDSLQMLRPALWMLLIGVGLLAPSIFDAPLMLRVFQALLALLLYAWVLVREFKANEILKKIL
jgi:hypothetical protein